MSFDAAHCTLCPRQCSADRTNGVGACHCGTEIRIARAALHYWEEPCISGKDGSGAVFFAGCAWVVFSAKIKKSAGVQWGKCLQLVSLQMPF